jgi:hypothetical protein
MYHYGARYYDPATASLGAVILVIVLGAGFVVRYSR